MSPVLITTLARIGLLLAAGACIGWLYGRPQLGVLVALAIALGWCMLWLFRLHRWLHGEKMPFLPQGSGIWPQIFARINFLKGRNKRRGKRFKALLKQMRQATRAFPDGGVILSDNNEIVTMNKVAEGLLGLKRKKDRGLRIENLIRDPDFVDYLRADNHSRPAEFPSPLANGRWLSSHLVPYGLEQKLLLVRDITEQRKADEMRRDFVANASHELRTPLTVITGYLDALSEDSVIAETLGGPVSEMQRQAARMRLLVDELLKLSEYRSDNCGCRAGRPVD